MTDTLHKIGKLLGYPECCVKRFSEGRFFFLLPEDEQEELLKHKPSGYMPCEHHMAEIMAGRKVSDILGRTWSFTDKQINYMWEQIENE